MKIYMKLRYHFIVVGFSSILFACLLSISRTGSVGLGVGVLVAPFLCRPCIGVVVKDPDRYEKTLFVFDYSFIGIMVFIYVMILYFGTVPNNTHIGWPD